MREMLKQGISRTEMARRLGKGFGWVDKLRNAVQAMSELVGEITTYTDADGHTVTRLPAAYARGVSPQKSAGSAKGG